MRLPVVSILAFAVAPSFHAHTQSIIVDHNSVALFDHIPPQYKAAAENLRLFFMDRSVGGNISDALDCLASPVASAPSRCKRYEHGGTPSFSVDPSEVSWSGVWNRGNWRYEYWPSGCSEDAVCFINSVEPRIDSFDVVGFQHSYLAVIPGANINHPVDGYFGTSTTRSNAKSYAAFAARYPNKKVIWWTTSLARGIGTPESETFNDAMRQVARDNNLILFDVADILSHDPDGNPCFDNRDGKPYAFGANSENHPDDGLDIPAICPHYTTETEGGHLGAVSAGGIRVAKAFWVLMARIAGWDGVTGVERIADRDFDIRIAPHPTTRDAAITYRLKTHGFIRIELFDLSGKKLRTLFEGEQVPGEHVQNLSTAESSLEPGVFFIRISAQGRMKAEKLVVVEGD